ncbi:transglutaminase-like cysteine peptidase [Rhizobium rhododendri]|uniref:Transglutaminase-like cysteine peptidase n=1 Tax=Rhizobium rhododendri TaxID=2506430 RepID=A0ABY8INZ9_9HYPH|nr:transglutaminase-like cysteine peptidase [Rhizobium rhododendri]WFS25191.1 transglutaminase-like cysteine peptidase [Rhizobium rhododendri]
MLSAIISNKVASSFIAPVGIFLSIITMPAVSHAAGPAGQAKGSDTAITRIVEGERTLAPFASVVFCVQQPDQCKDTGGADVVMLDEAHRRELTDVNSAVNRSIRPVNDPPGTDIWSVDVAQGDCEDFALTKRKHLLALGWSSRALRIAVARTPSGEGHAVLIANTSEGDLVLDNRTGRIKDWLSTDLHWVMFQSEQGPQRWVGLKTGRPATMMVSKTPEAPATAKITPRELKAHHQGRGVHALRKVRTRTSSRRSH